MTVTTERPIKRSTLEPLQVTINQAAQLLSYNERTVRMLIEKGKLRTTGNGRGKRVVVASIKAYLEREAV